MNRRRWLGLGALALAFGGFGAWVASRRYAIGDADSAAIELLYGLTLPDAHGAPTALAALRGQPAVVNFWATWCPPCVDELPLLNAFHTEHAGRGWQVLGLAVDQPSAVRRFMQQLPLVFPVGMAGLAGTELSRSLGNLGGGLPFSVVFDAGGAVAHQKVGKVSEADLAQWAQLG